MRCKPTKRQLDFMSWEFGAFFHFGIRTFCLGHTDWDRKEMDIEQVTIHILRSEGDCCLKDVILYEK